MASLSVNTVFANNANESDNSNNVTAKIEEWEYNPTKEAELSLFSMELAESIASEGSSSAADIVKVNVTATNKSTGLGEKIENANVRLFVGETEKRTAKTNSDGVAEISLAGLSLEERLNATISADKVVSLGKAIDGAARDSLFNNYPKDIDDLDGDGNTSEYIRYQTELHSEWIDRNGNWNGTALPKTIESNKVDIAFAIDATGSMGDEINNVKDNVAAFSKNLIDKGLDIRFSIIEYRDITCSEPTINHTNSSGSNWYRDIDSVVEVLGNISVSGGGDTPETAIDALGMMADKDNMSWRSDAHKFAFVLTDADYKVNNNYGYENLDDITRTLAGMNVVTSVITSTGYCQNTYKSLYDTTGGIFANINASNFNAEMLALSDSIATSVTREIDLVLSEPRMKVNMAVCYFADDSTSQSFSYRNSVKNVLNEYAHRVAETTDGHVLIDKIILFNTDNRLNFYDTSNQAAMADIRMESEVKDDGTWLNNVEIHNNAYVFGFFFDDQISADDSYFSAFKHLKKTDDFIGRNTFYRILSGGIDINGWSMIDDAYNFSATQAHETGHYLMGFRDEYQDADSSNWGSNKPYPEYGLMDNQYADIEMSKSTIDYAYMSDNFNGTDKARHTEHSWTRKASCEDALIETLTTNNTTGYGLIGGSEYNATGEYSIKYTKTLGKDRTAPYSYAGLEESDFITTVTASGGSGGGGGSAWSLMGISNTVSSTYFDDIEKTSKSVAGFMIKSNTSDVAITMSPISGYTYELYYIKAGDEEYNKVETLAEADKLTASVPVSAGELTEIRLIAVKDDKKAYNTYFVDRSEATDKGYMYNSADGSVMAYVTADEESTYTFIADNTSYKNGEYVSVNQATVVDSDNDVTIDSGEIYSIASYKAEIDYSTLSWFKFKDDIWTKIDTDYSEEENMNIGARADLNGEGLYVLMAKEAPVGEVNKETNLSYTQSSDRDAVVTLNFDDSNSDSKYYNVYYSEDEFRGKNDKDVICRTFNANSDDITLNLVEKNRVVYAAVEIVTENGSRSKFSDLIRLEAGEADSDGDGIPDWYCDKYRLWGEAGEEKDIANSDDDGDGLTNLEEYNGGSDPTNPNDPEHTTNIAVDALEISPTTKNVNIGSTTKLTAIISPENASNKNVRWSIEDESIASIAADGDTCTVKGISEGTTTVYAVSVDGGYSASSQITVSNKTSSGGGGTSLYTVKFETNGGNKVSNKSVRRNNTLAEPTAPIKDGFTFEGWYTDKELTKEYDFSEKVTKGFTLYAKWEDIKKSQIILTIGDKEALVFGESKENDVTPKIVNDRTMLPIRFIAEALGAEVEWNGLEQKVTIVKDDIEIIITINSDKAIVNGKTVTLDSPAFIENDRTYLPLRFISENLGAKVEWVEDTQQVIITK